MINAAIGECASVPGASVIKSTVTKFGGGTYSFMGIGERTILINDVR